MSRQTIVSRLLYLRNWELVNIFLLPIFLYGVLTLFSVKNWQPYAFGMFIVCFILMQGVFYWHLKLQTIINNEISLPPYFRQTFLFFNAANIALLLIYPIAAVSSELMPFVNFRVSLRANALFIFAFLEYINYYHYQLSHDSLNDIRYLMRHRIIRRSPLYTDLQRNKK